MSFRGGASLSSFCSRGLPSPSGMKFCHRIVEALGYHDMVKTRTPSQLGLDQYRLVTNGQTDRITVANTHYSWLC